jgi:hypothetical protein
MEVCGVGTAEYGDDTLARGEKVFRDSHLVTDDLGFLGAVAETIAATDAAIEYYIGITLVDLDGLDGATADAGIAFTALFLDGYDGFHVSPGVVAREKFQSPYLKIRKCAMLGTHNSLCAVYGTFCGKKTP